MHAVQNIIYIMRNWGKAGAPFISSGWLSVFLIVASTKTLAKMANKLAKSGDGVQNVSGPIRRRTRQLPGPNPAQGDARLGR